MKSLLFLLSTSLSFFLMYLCEYMRIYIYLYFYVLNRRRIIFAFDSKPVFEAKNHWNKKKVKKEKPTWLMWENFNTPHRSCNSKNLWNRSFVAFYFSSLFFFFFIYVQKYIFIYIFIYVLNCRRFVFAFDSMSILGQRSLEYEEKKINK